MRNTDEWHGMALFGKVSPRVCPTRARSEGTRTSIGRAEVVQAQASDLSGLVSGELARFPPFSSPQRSGAHHCWNYGTNRHVCHFPANGPR